MDDITAALVSAVLSGVFEDNYIDVSSFKIKDMTSGYTYPAKITKNP